MESTVTVAGIIVVGSANQDYIVRVSTQPREGETVLASSLVTQPGGKGANQAVAAARLGGKVSFIACVGDDSDGTIVLRQLQSEGIDTTHVEITERGHTGIALISVFDSGDNSIIVVPGANLELKPHRVDKAVERLASEAAVLVVQAELLAEVIETAMSAAQRHRIRPILNLAPFQPLTSEVLALGDPIVVNEAEASALTGWPVHDRESALRAVDDLRQRSRSIVITLGAGGAFWGDRESSGHVPAPRVDTVVDTTGAGDAFVGALATVLARHGTLEEAVELGVRAGSFSVTRTGAQSSYATASDLGAESG